MLGQAGWAAATPREGLGTGDRLLDAQSSKQRANVCVFSSWQRLLTRVSIREGIKLVDNRSSDLWVHGVALKDTGDYHARHTPNEQW